MDGGWGVVCTTTQPVNKMGMTDNRIFFMGRDATAPACSVSSMNLILAAISGEAVLHAILWLVVAGLIYWVLNWGLKKIGLPEPFNKIATVHPIIRW